jgi:hypothetical protein
MPSNIVPNTIDHTYPVAGRDNDSQGFRDNFTNIKNNFEYAEAEIDDLQANGIFKSALTGGSLDNDMSGALISNAQIKGFREVRVANPETAGVINLDVSAGQYQTISTSTNAITLSFTNWASAGNYSKIRVQIEIDNILHTITLPSQVTLGYVQGLLGNVITVPAGTYIYEFSTQDAGATIIISDITPLPVIYRTIATSTGSAGDHIGMMAYDVDFIYTCLSDYDGSTAIWKRVASGVTW